MALKRRLLQQHLEKLAAEKGLDIPIFVDSFIVFSAPKGQFIKIDDRYGKEKHCFRTSINKKIENYTNPFSYSLDQLAQLGDLLAQTESNVKRFETQLNYDDIRRSIAEAMVELQDKPVAPEKSPVVEQTINPHPKKLVTTNRTQSTQNTRARQIARWGYAAASVLAGVIWVGLRRF